MEFITIFSSLDRTEISIITHLFEDNNIKHNVLGEATMDSSGIAGAGNTGYRVQVPKDSVDDAKAVLLENGFLGNWQKGRLKKETHNRSKWVLIFLSALVLIIVSFLIMWFMNP